MRRRPKLPEHGKLLRAFTCPEQQAANDKGDGWEEEQSPVHAVFSFRST